MTGPAVPIGRFLRLRLGCEVQALGLPSGAMAMKVIIGAFSGPAGWSLGILALPEGLIGDALEERSVVLQRADIGPGDLVGTVVEVIVAQV